MQDVTKYLSTYEKVLYQETPDDRGKGLTWLLEIVIGLVVIFLGIMLLIAIINNNTEETPTTIIVTVPIVAVHLVIGGFLILCGFMDLFAKTARPDNYIYIITNLRVLKIDIQSQTIDYIRLNPQMELTIENPCGTVGDLTINRLKTIRPVHLEDKNYIRDYFHQQEIDYNESISITFKNIKNVYDVRQIIVDLVNEQIKESKKNKVNN